MERPWAQVKPQFDRSKVRRVVAQRQQVTAVGGAAAAAMLLLLDDLQGATAREWDRGRRRRERRRAVIGELEHDAIGADVTHDEPEVRSGLDVLGQLGLEHRARDAERTTAVAVGVDDASHDRPARCDPDVRGERGAQQQQVNGEWGNHWP